MADKIPNAGEMDTRIKILSRTDVPVNNADIESQYANKRLAWAKMRSSGSALFYGSQQVNDGITDTFIFLRRKNLNEKNITSKEEIFARGCKYEVKRARALGLTHVLVETVLLDIEDDDGSSDLYSY